MFAPLPMHLMDTWRGARIEEGTESRHLGRLPVSVQLFQGYFAGECRAESRGHFVALLRGIHHSLSAAIVLLRNGSGLFRHFIESSPVLIFDGNGNTPVVGTLRHGVGEELIVHNPTLLFEFVVDWSEVLPNIRPEAITHACFYVDVNHAPNRTIVVIGILRN